MENRHLRSKPRIISVEKLDTNYICYKPFNNNKNFTNNDRSCGKNKLIGTITLNDKFDRSRHIIRIDHSKERKLDNSKLQKTQRKEKSAEYSKISGNSFKSNYVWDMSRGWVEQRSIRSSQFKRNYDNENKCDCYNNIDYKDNKYKTDNQIDVLKFCDPEYNSIRCTINKVCEMQEKLKSQNIPVLSPNDKQRIMKKVSTVRNYLPSDKVYKNLIDLSFDEKDLVPPKKRNPSKSTLKDSSFYSSSVKSQRNDQVPLLNLSSSSKGSSYKYC